LSQSSAKLFGSIRCSAFSASAATSGATLLSVANFSRPPVCCRHDVVVRIQYARTPGPICRNLDARGRARLIDTVCTCPIHIAMLLTEYTSRSQGDDPRHCPLHKGSPGGSRRAIKSKFLRNTVSIRPSEFLGMNAR
jgi:hypothetical protein